MALQQCATIGVFRYCPRVFSSLNCTNVVKHLCIYKLYVFRLFLSCYRMVLIAVTQLRRAAVNQKLLQNQSYFISCSAFRVGMQSKEQHIRSVDHS